MNRADCKALRSAAIELAGWAATISESYFDFDHGTRKVEWEPGPKATYDKHLRLVKRLRQIANAEQKQIEQDRAAREFQAQYDDGDIE